MDAGKVKQVVVPGLWGVVLGALVLAIVGFNWGGWVTGGTADEMVKAAVAERLVPICVDQFSHAEQKSEKLAELKKIDYWKRADFVSKSGWATMPGAEEADAAVAEECAKKIALG